MVKDEMSGKNFLNSKSLRLINTDDKNKDLLFKITSKMHETFNG